MIPLEQCATILNKGKEKYDNEQVKNSETKTPIPISRLTYNNNEKIALTKKQEL